MTTTAPEHFTPHAYVAPHAYVDPYAVDATEALWPAAPDDCDQGADDHLLPPPNPAERLSIGISPRDHRRLDLHAALTAAGIPPRPEDRDAIEQLSALSGSVNAALQRWLHHPK
ncbi:hypothetical protein ACWGH3_16060 [Streptomyces sp. NPDC054884]|uniref:hypothetical protein n=1 Tax=Streptomyces sp. ME08-AFT2 TaxID=3028683 RepID=UPI0029B9A145|nr:hypothetical protein [Streptomyces sp. ME08-AFT2]MDX3310925.1 hypothetical protein [Streptomyces sp. ME08-AFT2]